MDRWNADKVNRTRDSTVVPPVRIHRWNPFSFALVVHFHDQEIVSFSQQIRDFELKWGESANVLTYERPIEIYLGLVVDGPEMDISRPSLLLP